MKYLIYAVLILQCACNPSEEDSNSLYVKTPVIDIGRIPKTNDFEVQFNLTLNSSSKELHIRGFKQSCYCFDITPSNRKIQPGQSASFTTVINLEKTHIDKATNQFHLFAWPIVGRENGKPIILEQAKIEMCGSIYDPLHIDKSEINLGKLLEGEQHSVELEIGVLEPGWEIEVKQEPCFWSAEIFQMTNESVFRIVLSEKERIPLGKFEDTLIVSAKHDANRPIYRSIQISGMIEGRVKINPEQLNFGVLNAGGTFTVSLKLQTPLNSIDYQIKDYEIPDAFRGLESRISKDGQTIDLTLLPVEEGVVNDKVKVLLKSNQGDTRICAVNLSGIVMKKSQGKEARKNGQSVGGANSQY